MWMRDACSCIFCCVTFLFLSSGAVCCSPNCGVLGWTPWKPCTPVGEQARDVLLCCPTNLEVQTLEECLRVCNLTKEITVSKQNCTFTPIHNVTTMVPERSSVVSSASDVNSLEILSSTTTTSSLNVEFSSDFSSPTIYSPSLSSEGTDKGWTEDTPSTLGGSAVSVMTSSETPNVKTKEQPSSKIEEKDFTSAVDYSSSLSTGEEATLDMSSTVGGTAEFMMTSSETPTARTKEQPSSGKVEEKDTSSSSNPARSTVTHPTSTTRDIVSNKYHSTKDGGQVTSDLFKTSNARTILQSTHQIPGKEKNPGLDVAQEHIVRMLLFDKHGRLVDSSINCRNDGTTMKFL